MRLYAGQPVHSAFNIGHKVCIPDLIDFIQKVFHEQIACEPAADTIIDYQVVPQVAYKAAVKTLNSNGKTFRISILQADQDQLPSRIFFNYCFQTSNTPHLQRFYPANNLQQLFEEVTSDDSNPTGQTDFFVYTKSEMDLRIVKRFLRESFREICTLAQESFTIPQQKSDVVLYYRALQMPSYYFIAYWLEGAIFEADGLEESAKTIISNLFNPYHYYTMSHLGQFKNTHEITQVESNRFHSVERP